MTKNADRKLFSPVQIGPIMLAHRVVMGPLTRSRSDQSGDVTNDLMAEYYRQRASEGGLIISEATTISLQSKGWFGAPGIYSDEQAAGWRKVIGAVHAKVGRMFLQLWHAGRSSHIDNSKGLTTVAPSVDPYYGLDPTTVIFTSSDWTKPSPHRALEITEIPGIVEDYRKAGQEPVAAARLRKIFKAKIVAAGGFEPDTAEAIVEKGDADLVAFGRHFLATPDLPKRIKLGLPLNAHDRETFYTRGGSRGYTDYPFYGERHESKDPPGAK